MKRRFRLASSIEIQRVRRTGKSFAHPLLVLVVNQGDGSNSRFAVTAGGAIGNAVKRNRAKRLIRAALRSLLDSIQPGFDCILIARKPLINSSYEETRHALQSQLLEAGLIGSKTDE